MVTMLNQKPWNVNHVTILASLVMVQTITIVLLVNLQDSYKLMDNVLNNAQMVNTEKKTQENVSLVLIPIVVLAHLVPVVDLASTKLSALFALVLNHVQMVIMVITVIGSVKIVPMNVTNVTVHPKPTVLIVQLVTISI